MRLMKHWMLRGSAILAVVMVSVALGSRVRAAEMDVQTSKTTDKLVFGGDIRVRHESFFNKTRGVTDRHRERFRLRFGATASIQDFLVGLKLASGTGEQVSTNQTFGNAFNEKGIYIDQAYLQWKAHEYARVFGGRMPNPFWGTYASDLVWDKDVNPEGYAQQIEIPAGEMFSFFGNFAQLPINEISGSSQDPWVFGNQVGTTVRLGEDAKVKFGVTYYSFLHERQNVFLSTAAADSPNIQEANTRVAGSARLASAFQIMHYTMETTFHALSLPVSLQGDYVKNVARSNTLETVPNQRSGYQIGAILGKAKNAGTWEFAYFRKYLEANATISDWADSDFGNGGTNRTGHIMWLAYAPREYVTIQAKYFITKKLNEFISSSAPFTASATTPAYSDINRLQLDLVVKF